MYACLQPLRFWSRKEGATRAGALSLTLEEEPCWATAFTLPPPPGAAAAAPAAAAEEDDEDQPQPAANDPEPQRPLLLNAAAHLGSQFCPPASTPLQPLLSMMLDHLGAPAVDVIRALLGSSTTPAAAKGFWGALFLGLMVSTTDGVPFRGATGLLEELWVRSRNSSTTAILSHQPTPGKLGGGPSQQRQAGEAGGSGPAAAVAPAPEQGPLNRYSLREFLSAVLVLLRYRELQGNMKLDGEAIRELHGEILQVSMVTSRIGM